ncbi:carboxymuconolactone decarboxylase family protein [Alloacidobacterium sp.]|uniref:carboxymuconolactone decarboxylase family protein n=1 Tax=Alloacidobacterium sp. TaxID=2951999 RepID=UPI002D2D17E3|nr:carboxymuconolactone decarboxylase family protein [Alloacidobacterium sp.]HYK37532.1 carboxymuconolactone decarboxylase family protein [Alloacidobacterium sp.]
METRLDYQKAFPEGVQGMLHLEAIIRRSGLEPSLYELVKIRASQLNGCAFCIDMHTKDARAKGETEQRIYALSAWRETPFFTERERAALGWTEAVTNIQNGHAPEKVYNQTRLQFSEEDLAKLTFAITQINSWNRIAISFRAEVGNYQPQAAAAHH